VATRPPYRQTFVRLLGFLRPYKWSLLVSIVLAVGSQAAAIGIAWLTGTGLEKALFDPESRQLYVIAALVLTVGAARALFMAGRRLISGRQALGVEFDMRNLLYAKLLRLSFGFYDRHQTGQLLSRATVDLQTVRFFLGYGLVFFFQNVLTIVGATAIMFFVNWRLALVATAVTPLIVVFAYRYSSVAHPVLRDVQQRMADVATVAEENIVGVHVVKSFAQERKELDKFADRTERVFARSIDANKQRALYVPLLSFLPLIMQAGVLLVGGRMVANGSLDFGTFFFFNLLVVMLVMPLRMLGMWVGQSQRATASGERIFEVMDEP
jgi:ABC-type multidrug transport system fused ATPase/permease subunit